MPRRIYQPQGPALPMALQLLALLALFPFLVLFYTLIGFGKLQGNRRVRRVNMD